jgi:hypothetical protein
MAFLPSVLLSLIFQFFLLNNRSYKVPISLVFFFFCKILCTALINLKLPLCLTNWNTTPWRHMGECICRSHFLDLGTSWRWSVSRSDRISPFSVWTGGLMGLTIGLDDVERRQFLILPGLELWPLGRPARSQSLYRLSYPGSCTALRENTFLIKRSEVYVGVFHSVELCFPTTMMRSV